MGVGSIMAAKQTILFAWGEKKAEIVKKAVEGSVNDIVTASFLQEHSNARFVVDEAAGSLLEK